ncbi:MAG: O-antigen ligase family protein, partial [Anaerolineae bacterium]|nr:O-antigen ligase family protein [Anaerolineae bacterium]
MNLERSLISLQKIFVESDRRFVLALTAALGVAAGLIVGAYVAILSPIYAVAGVLALVGGLLMLRDTQWGLMGLIGLICLLPFGALPFKIGFTPTFLDLVLIATYVVWLARIATGKTPKLVGTTLGPPIVVFLLLACASFVAGLGHAYLDTYVLRHFVELLLSIGLFFVVVNCVQTREQLRVLLIVLLLAGFAAASIGVILYYIPADWSIRLLSALGRVGYPSGPGVLRYVEDSPDLALRAISTSTDPNVLGGLLILVTTLTAAQLFAREPVLPRAALAVMALVDAGCLYLTYSRGSMAGLAVGLGVLALVKYRRLIPMMVVAAALLLLLPQAQGYVQHFVEGIQMRDLATLMRLGEYKDALALIARHPWIGVGFVSAPEISLYIGVSNVYLLIAEEMGLVGLGVFLLVLFLFFRTVWRAWPLVRRVEGLEATLLGLTAALVGILVGGLLDHYFFNLSFPHSVSIFWIYMGLAMVTVRLGVEGASPDAAVAPPTCFESPEYYSVAGA